jgi:hypothetical protein
MRARSLCIVIALVCCASCGTRELDSLPSVGVDATVGEDQSGGVTCNAAGSPDPYSSQQGLETRLVGRWALCANTRWAIALGEPWESGCGLEFLSDGRFFVLVQGPAGLVRGTGVDFEGSWIAQVDRIRFEFASFGLVEAEAIFRKAPAMMRLIDILRFANPADYVRLP